MLITIYTRERLTLLFTYWIIPPWNRYYGRRLQLFQDTQKVKYVAYCNGQWKRLAQQKLERNTSCVEEFSSTVINLLVKQHGKRRNILIFGPANCAKSFLRKLLCTIFNAFVNWVHNFLARYASLAQGGQNACTLPQKFSARVWN